VISGAVRLLAVELVALEERVDEATDFFGMDASRLASIS
jgi:hypothetical protein